MYFAASNNMLTKKLKSWDNKISRVFFLNNKISRVSLLAVLVFSLKDPIRIFLLSALSSQNVAFHLYACLMVTKCLLQIQPLHPHGRQKEAVKNRVCLICPLLQRELSMMPPFSAKFLSDLIVYPQATGLPLTAMNSLGSTKAGHLLL